MDAWSIARTICGCLLFTAGLIYLIVWPRIAKEPEEDPRMEDSGPALGSIALMSAGVGIVLLPWILAALQWLTS